MRNLILSLVAFAALVLSVGETPACDPVVGASFAQSYAVPGVGGCGAQQAFFPQRTFIPQRAFFPQRQFIGRDVVPVPVGGGAINVNVQNIQGRQRRGLLGR